MAFAAPATADGYFSGWEGEASLAGSNTTGNTETTDIGVALKLAKEADIWRHKFKALADYGETDNEKNKQRFSLGYQLDRDLNDRTYVFVNGDYFNDDFGSYQDGYYLGVGVGRKIILPAPISWNLEGGAGFRSQTEQDIKDSAGNVTVQGDTEEEFALRGFSDFDYEINDKVSLFNDTEILWSDSDTHIWNDIGLTAKLTERLSARASYRVDNHSDVPAGVEKTDTITRFGIVYSMK